MSLPGAPVPPPPPGTPPPPPPPPPRQRTFGATLGLLAVLFPVLFGGFIAASGTTVPSGEPIAVAPGVTVTPPPGWAVVKQQAGPPAVLTLSRGSAAVDVLVAADFSDPMQVLESYRREVLGPQARSLQFSDQTESVAGPAGLSGVRGSYVGDFEGFQQTLEGEVTAFATASGSGVVFDAYGAQGDLDAARQEIHDMIDGAVLA